MISIFVQLFIRARGQTFLLRKMRMIKDFYPAAGKINRNRIPSVYTYKI